MVHKSSFVFSALRSCRFSLIRYHSIVVIMNDISIRLLASAKPNHLNYSTITITIPLIVLSKPFFSFLLYFFLHYWQLSNIPITIQLDEPKCFVFNVFNMMTFTIVQFQEGVERGAREQEQMVGTVHGKHFKMINHRHVVCCVLYCTAICHVTNDWIILFLIFERKKHISRTRTRTQREKMRANYSELQFN